MIQGRWRLALMNIRTRPGADFGSNHQLLCATIKIRMRSWRKQTKTFRYDVTKIPEAFSVEMQNRFLPLLQSDDNGEWRSDTLWEQMDNITKEVAETNIPRRRTLKRPWLSDDTLDIARRRRRKAKASGNHQEWRELDKQYNRQALEDKRNHQEEICLEAEDASQKGNIKSVFRLVKELSRKGKWTPRSDVINDKEGNILTEEEDIKARWREYSTDLYRRRQEDCVKIWNDVEWLIDWCRAVFVPIPKKGNPRECSNHRTISLIVHASKILLRIIVGRLQRKYGSVIAEEQAGFVKGRGTGEQIVNIRMMIEKFKECNIPLYVCFIDYSKALDCVRHSKLWDVTKDMGFPEHLVALLARLYQDQQSSVRTSVGDTEKTS
ncbi:uncharacterized protein LOC106879609 [Octopus bimaculoides]|uniref:uncharacterized protein LOC106879609 n=1 Tax=Octopus bimaculoides TaxID=37653 RepID=UPI00071CCDF4|nr:uncharacterized protein LOC106879609 [Octopus bimaculoides]|eukprot:XP_014784746.1 PREDICTED: uncharacterized protein LOC106879609 [Octopus bimaculoides]